MKVGLVCPYSLDVPGGVQNHVRDLAEVLLARGHEVSVLAPSEADGDLPGYVVSAGGAVPVPYNGSVARLSFGPVVAARARRWLRQGFDVVHVHEPATPSVSLLTLAATDGEPVVATFHTAQVRSRAMSASAGLLRPWLEKVTARIAVSEYARDTLVQHLGGEPVVIPNGVYVDRFAEAEPRPEWRGDPTLAFVGRIDEPRKGLDVLLRALPALRERHPGLRVLVVGGGDLEAVRGNPGWSDAVTLLGRVDDVAKAAALKTADLYVAPNTGGESFGIVLVEAMAAGTPVLASDLGAFARVLEGGRAGALFPVGDSDALAGEAARLLADEERRTALVRAASSAVRAYDWERVATRIVEVYETVVR